MSSILPDAPNFETPVYGTVFGERARVVHRLREGDQLILVPDPPGVEQPSVWVHALGGDVVGHLSPDVNRWLAPRMMEGARYGARVRCQISAAHTRADLDEAVAAFIRVGRRLALI